MSLIKKIKQFINGSWYEFILDSGTSNLNLKNGEGLDSIVQKYSGEPDTTHYGNINTGESAVVFGEANDNTANRALLWGKLNKNSGQNIVGGLRNNVGGSHNIVGGQQNGGVGTDYDSVTLTATKPTNINSSLILGMKNEVGVDGGEKVNHSIIAGLSNIVNDSDEVIVAGRFNNVFVSGSSLIIGNSNTHNSVHSLTLGYSNKNISNNSIVAGRYNVGKNNALFELGRGSSDTDRKNAFEVLIDGRAKVYGTPIEDEDVVRKTELDAKYDKTGGFISGDVSIQGNLTVSGETTTLDTVTLQVKDNVIVANADGAELVENAGFAMKTSPTSAYGIMYDPIGDGVKIGLGTFNNSGKFIYGENEAQFLATRADNIINGNLPVWNDTKKSFEDSNVNVVELQNTVKVLQEQVVALQEELAAITVATEEDIKTIFNKEA